MMLLQNYHHHHKNYHNYYYCHHHHYYYHYYLPHHHHYYNHNYQCNHYSSCCCCYDYYLLYSIVHEEKALPMLEFLLLRGLWTVTIGKNTFSCEYSNVTSFPRKIWNIKRNSNWSPEATVHLFLGQSEMQKKKTHTGLHPSTDFTY